MNNLAPLPAIGAIGGRKRADKVRGSGGWRSAAAMAGVTLAAAAILNKWRAKRGGPRQPWLRRSASHRNRELYLRAFCH